MMKRKLFFILVCICLCFSATSCLNKPATFDTWHNKINDYLKKTYIKSMKLEDKICSVIILLGVVIDWSKELSPKNKRFIAEQKEILDNTLKIVKKTRPPKDFKVFHEQILKNLKFWKQSLEAMEDRNPLYMAHLGLSGNECLRMAIYELKDIFSKYGSPEEKTAELNAKIKKLNEHNELLSHIAVAAMSHNL